MKNEKPWYKKWWVFLLGVVMIAIIIAIPFIINETYKYGLTSENPYITMWGAADVLNFYGTLLGALSTIIALYITIRFTAYQSLKEQKEQRILLINDYKKQEILKENSKYIKKLEKLKSLFLLEIVDEFPTNIIYILEYDDVRLNRLLNEIVEQNYTLNILQSIDSPCTAIFLEKFNLFKENIINEFQNLSVNLLDLKKQQENYEVKVKENKNNFFNTLNDMKKNEEDRKKIERTKPRDERDFKNDFFESIRMFRDDNKDEFLKLFDEMIKENQEDLDIKINALYKQQEEK